MAGGTRSHKAGAMSVMRRNRIDEGMVICPMDDGGSLPYPPPHAHGFTG